MKFQSEIMIDRPIEQVTALWSDSRYYKEHQEGFLRKEMQSGNEGEDGAIAKLYFKHGRHEMELTETIVSNQLPNFLEAFYHHKHMDNTLTTSFTKMGTAQTLYAIEGEYVAVRGFMPKVMMSLLPSMFRKQPEKWMRNYKAFAEQHLKEN